MFAFTRDPKKNEVASELNRIINQSTPRSVCGTDESRSKRRYSRTMPVLLGPWFGDRTEVDRFTVAIANNISEEGIAVSVSQEWLSPDVILGFWCESATFIKGVVRHRVHLGKSFWQLGVELEEVIRPSQITNFEGLKEIVRALEPHVLTASA